MCTTLSRAIGRQRWKSKGLHRSGVEEEEKFGFAKPTPQEEIALKKLNSFFHESQKDATLLGGNNTIIDDDSILGVSDRAHDVKKQQAE